MYRRRRVGLLFFALIPLFVLSQEAVSVSKIVANKDGYDNKIVSVTGTINNYREKVSRRGNDYTTFKLDDGTGSISIYSRGHLHFKDGVKVKVEGVFTKVKKVGNYTFYDEIEAECVGLVK